jgi:flagellar biosynthesis protein FliQ
LWLIFVPKILDVTDDVHFDGRNLAHQKHGSTPQLWLIFVPKILVLRTMTIFMAASSLIKNMALLHDYG